MSAWIDPIIKGWEAHFHAPRHYAAGNNGMFETFLPALIGWSASR